MKKYLIIFFIFIFVFLSFTLNVSAIDVSNSIPFNSSYQYRIVVYDLNTDVYRLYQSATPFTFVDVVGGLSIYNQKFTYCYYSYRYETQTTDPNFQKWSSVITLETDYTGFVHSKVGVKNIFVIWSTHDVFIHDSSTVYFAATDSVNLSNFNFDVSNGSTNFDDSGIIAGINSMSTVLSNKLDILLNGVKDNILSIKNALYTTVDGVSFSVSEFMWVINQNIIGVKNQITIMSNMIATLPEDIAVELDTLLNPDSEHLPGSFGGTVSSTIEDKFSIVEDMKTVFSSVENQNSPIVINHDVKVGSFIFPVNIDFTWYEPYRMNIRSGIGGLFWVMCLISCWATFSGIFGIGVKSGVGAYMNFQETKGFDPELTSRLQNLGYKND